MKIQVIVEGGAELAAKLRRMDERAADALERATMRAAELVRDEANSLAPGPHIEAEVIESSRDRVLVAIGPDKEHWYYRFVETGTQPHEITGNPLLAFEGVAGLVVTGRVSHPGMAARPFLRPALDSRQSQAVDEFGVVLRLEIEAAT